jgi:hypothetical protein
MLLSTLMLGLGRIEFIGMGYSMAGVLWHLAIVKDYSSLIKLRAFLLHKFNRSALHSIVLLHLAEVG